MSDAEQASEPRYVLDTSALIDLKDEYPRRAFPTLWQRIEELCDRGIIISVREVRREIERGSDELVPWVKARPDMFKMPTVEEAVMVGTLQDEHPSWVDPAGTNPDADPFVVAAAHCRDLVVITHEKPNKLLRVAAKRLEVRCLRIAELVAEEGWQF